MPTGRLANGQYQAGARRTSLLSETTVWSQWTSPEGLGRWLLRLDGPLEEGREFTAAGGVRVHLVRVRAPSQLRLRLEHDDWPHARTAQLRVLKAATGATLALHLEGLADAREREEVLARWKRELEALPAPR
jgi:uncharacterized protein YndB with AHSA1/START domain